MRVEICTTCVITSPFQRANLQNRVHNSLNKLFATTLSLSKYIGLTIFSLRSDNSIQFSVRSQQTFFIFLRVILTTSILQYEAFLREVESRFGEKSKTESFVLTLLEITIIISDALFISLLFVRRNCIIMFHRSLLDLIEYLSNSEYWNSSSVIKAIEYSTTLAVSVKKIIFGLFAFVAISMPVTYAEVMTGMEQYRENYWALVLPLPLLSNLWGYEMFLRHIGKLWLITLLHVLKITVEHISLLGNLNTPLLGKMNQLLQQFNEAFGIILVLEMLTLMIAITLICFQIIMWVARGNLGPVSFNLLLLGAHSFFIFAICEASSQVDIQVKYVKLLRVSASEI